MKNFFLPLMENNITKDDKEKLINFLKNTNSFTQSKNVANFERKWSQWLGVKYSVFVNSGSSANLLTMSALKIIEGSGEVLVPTLTWVSDIASVIQNNFKPVFIDIDPKNLAMDENEIKKKVTKKTKAVFLSHIQGFNGLSTDLLKFLKRKKIHLIEDVCESHGATFKNKKLGSFGLISNFSFYYAHHLSTIEGGMICTNSKKVYEILRMLRSHGMVREAGNINYEKMVIKKNKDLSPKFIFMYPAYNVRNNELQAVIGLNQLKRLDKNNKIRSSNLIFFLKNLNPKLYRTNYNTKGNSNYAFPLVLVKKNMKNRNLLEKKMNQFGIEFRRGNAGGGNQLRQPYIKKLFKKIKISNYPEVDHIHHYGYYIGNYPSLNKNKILKVCNILNNIRFYD